MGLAWDLHKEVGYFAAQSGIPKLFITGNFADAVKRGAREAGMAQQHIFSGNKDDIFNELKKELKPNNWILVKGSRGMMMETLVQDLLQEFDQVL